VVGGGNMNYFNAFFNISTKFVSKKLKSKRGILPVLAAVAAVVVIGLVAGDVISDGKFDFQFGGDDGNDAVVTGGEQVSNLSAASNNRENKLLAGYSTYSQQAAARDTLNIRQELSSHLTSYET
jgi:hypothetical protein